MKRLHERASYILHFVLHFENFQCFREAIHLLLPSFLLSKWILSNDIKPTKPSPTNNSVPNIKISYCRDITVVRFISEEVFGSNKALWFSPSGNKLAFGYFDDSQTPIITIPFYGYPGSMSFQYTTAISIHYPKVSVQKREKEGGGSLFCISFDLSWPGSRRITTRAVAFVCIRGTEF